HGVPQVKNAASEEVRGQEPEQQQQDVEQNEPQPENRNAAGAKLLSKDPVEEREELPGNPECQGGGSEDEQSGEVIASETRPEPGSHRIMIAWRRISGGEGRIRTARRVISPTAVCQNPGVSHSPPPPRIVRGGEVW